MSYVPTGEVGGEVGGGGGRGNGLLILPRPHGGRACEICACYEVSCWYASLVAATIWLGESCWLVSAARIYAPDHRRLELNTGSYSAENIPLEDRNHFVVVIKH